MAAVTPERSFAGHPPRLSTRCAAVRGPVPRHRRLLDHERRAAVDPRRSGLLPAGPAVGAQRLPRHLRRVPAARRPRGRPVRAAAACSWPARPLFAACSLAGGLADQRRHAGRRPLRAGHRCGVDGAGRPVDPHHHASREGATAPRRWARGGRSAGSPPRPASSSAACCREGPGWRWVLFVNIPVCVAHRRRRVPRSSPVSGVGTRPADLRRPRRGARHRGMLLLIYALVKAPDVGWGTAHTIGELGTAGVLLAAFVVVERRTRTPLFPFAILRVHGLAAADATQLIALRRVPLDVLLPHPVHAERARLHPDPERLGLPAGHRRHQRRRRPFHAAHPAGRAPVRIIVAGALIAAAGMFELSRVPVHGSYLTRPAARPCGHVARARRRVRHRHHGRQRRRPRPPGRPRRRAAQHLAATRIRARAGRSSPRSPPPAPTRLPPRPTRSAPVDALRRQALRRGVHPGARGIRPRRPRSSPPALPTAVSRSTDRSWSDATEGAS